MEKQSSIAEKLIGKLWKVLLWIAVEAGLLLYLASTFGFNSTTGMGLIAFLLLLVGVDLASFGNFSNRRTLITFAYTFFLLGVFIFLTQYKDAATAFSAWAGLLVAFAAFMAIQESRRLRQETHKMHDEEKELASKKRRLEEVHRWVTEVMTFNSRGLVIAIPQGDYVAQTDADNSRTIAAAGANARAIAANKSYIILEAQRLDSDLNGLTQLKRKHPKQLKDIIESLSGSLENIGTSEESFSDFFLHGPLTRKIENNCIEAMQIISDLRAELKV